MISLSLLGGFKQASNLVGENNKELNQKTWKNNKLRAPKQVHRVYTVRENQGKPYLFRDGQGIQRKSQEKVGKSQGDIFGKFLSPMNQDPLFFKTQSIFFKIQLRQVTCEILISAAELMFLCMYALGVHSSFCCWLILYCSFIF